MCECCVCFISCSVWSLTHKQLDSSALHVKALSDVTQAKRVVEVEKDRLKILLVTCFFFFSHVCLLRVFLTSFHSLTHTNTHAHTHPRTHRHYSRTRTHIHTHSHTHTPLTFQEKVQQVRDRASALLAAIAGPDRNRRREKAEVCVCVCVLFFCVLFHV